MKYLFPVVFSAISVACAPVGPDFATPQIDLPQHYAFAHSDELNKAAQEPWWHSLNDPVLNELMARGISRNLDVLTAQERITEARALYRATGVASQISDSFDVSATASSEADDPELTTRFGAGFVFDLFGGATRQRQQARAEQDALAFEAASTTLALQSELAAAYIEARYFQDARAITERSIANRRETVNLIVSMIDRGELTEISRTRAMAQLSQVEADLPNLRNGFEVNVAQIATLLADPISLHLNRMRSTQDRLDPSVSFPSGVPANLLRNRPDILARERALEARMAAIGVAEAQIYPSLVLSGTVRVDGSNTVSLGPTLSIPILSRPRLAAQRDAAISRARQAELEWRNTVLQAVLEVETALIRTQNRRQEITLLRQASANFDRLNRLSQQSFELGATTILELLDAEQESRNSDLALARARRNLLLAVSELAVVTGLGARIDPTPQGSAMDPTLVASNVENKTTAAE